jgi:nucleoside-diphosphate-sugar epimerase
VSAFQNQTCLVVGGAGFVGSNLVKSLLEEGCAVVRVVDNLLSAERANVPDDPRVAFIEDSIADDVVLGKLQDEFDYVFHLSTYHGNQSSITNPLEDHANNLITTLKLYEQIKGFTRLKKVVYAASGCTLAAHTYDQAEATTEDGPVPLDLDSPYQISKVVGEFYSVYYHHQHKLPTVRARFQNVYGPGEILGAGRWRGTPATVWRNVTPTFVYRALKRMPLQVENEGKASRDFIYVGDIVNGLQLCATEGRPGDVYNLASGVETSILELATAINRMTDNSACIERLPGRPWDRSGKRFGSAEKAKRCLGFEAHVGLSDGLASTIEWTRRNLTLIDGCIRKHAAHMTAFAAKS